MSSFESKIKIGVLEHPEEQIQTSEPTEDPVVVEDLEDAVHRDQLRNDFLKFEKVEVNGTMKKAWEIMEENSFYNPFSESGKNDPFMEFEEYLRKSVGVGIYKNADFAKPSYGETGALLGKYKEMVWVIQQDVFPERKRLEVIDAELTDFFKERINHFLQTLETRVHDVALHRGGVESTQARGELEKQLTEKLPTEFLQQKKEEMMQIVSDVDERKRGTYIFRGSRLLKICKEITDRVNEILKNSIYTDPLMPDNYEA